MPDTTTPATALQPSYDTESYGDFYAIGQVYASGVHNELRFIPTDLPSKLGGTFWIYRDGVWRIMDANLRPLQQAIADGQPGLAYYLTEQGYHSAAQAIDPKAGRKEIAWRREGWAQVVDGIIGVCQKPIAPAPAPHVIGVQGGMLDLTDAKLKPDSPLNNLRARMGGRWLGLDCLDEAKGMLTDRLRHTFAAETLERLLELAAVGLTGYSQRINRAAVCLIWGKSGSGKGYAQNLVACAAGEYGESVDAKWLSGRGQSEIDSVSARILERDARMVFFTELAGNSDLSPGQILSKSGNEPRTVRAPYGQLIQGVLRTQLWAIFAAPPHYRESDAPGLRRRIQVMPTIGHDWDTGDTLDDPDAVDAMTTCILAALMDIRPAFAARSYAAPHTPKPLMDKLFVEFDSLRTWIDGRAADNPDRDPERAADLLLKGQREVDGNLTARSLGLALKAAGWIKRNAGRDRGIEWTPPLRTL